MTNGGGSDGKGMLKGIIALLVIVVVAFGFLNVKFRWIDLGFFGGGDNPAVGRDLKVIAIDVETQQKVFTTQKSGETYPLKNDAGRPTLWQAFACKKCKVLFPATPGKMFTPCPICGSSEVGAASVNGEEANWEVKMPATLPEIAN